jgi:hypothetical protein
MMILPDTHALLLPTQESALFLQAPQQPSQLPHHLPIRDPVRDALFHHQGKVEDEFIPAVLALANADRVANHAVVVSAKGEQAVAELLRRDQVRGYGLEVYERGGEGRRRARGRDAALGDLVEDAGACSPQLGRLRGAVRGNGNTFLMVEAREEDGLDCARRHRGQWS